LNMVTSSGEVLATLDDVSVTVTEVPDSDPQSAQADYWFMTILHVTSHGYGTTNTGVAGVSATAIFPVDFTNAEGGVIWTFYPFPFGLSINCGDSKNELRAPGMTRMDRWFDVWASTSTPASGTFARC